MNILILSASTGGGHMKAAKAIENYMETNRDDVNVKIIDTLIYISPLLNKTISSGYVNLSTKIPKLYKKLYKYTNRDNKSVNVVSTLNNAFSKKLIPLIEEYGANVIITTHPFATEMISRLKERKLINTPLICVMTDYAPHKTWINKKVDAYIVSNEDMIEEMVSKGVEESSIYPYGIPVDQVFLQKSNREIVLKDIGLSDKLPTILIMAGSFGVKNILKMYKDIAESSLSFQVIVITGKNHKLYNGFSEIVNKSPKNTKLIYFTDEVNKYMQVSDLLVTKPGGLTISEAIACNTPMAIFDAIPGQEEENAEFLLRHNMAIKLDKNKKCSDTIEDLLLHKDKLIDMKNSCGAFDKNNALKNISTLIHEVAIVKESNRADVFIQNS